MWYVYPKYELTDDGVIRPGLPPGVNRRDLNQLWKYIKSNPDKKEYMPVEHPEIVADFAKIERGDNGSSALGFVEKWGLLGRDGIIPGRKRPKESRGGDPLEWIWAHVEGAKWCLRVTRALETGEGIENIYLPMRGKEPLVVGHQWRFRLYTDAWWGPKDSPVSRQNAVRGLRQEIVNENIKSVRRELRTDETGKEESMLVYSGLIEMIYWHLADAICNSKVQQCQADDCQAFFIQTDQRQRFCRPEPGKPESACSRRQRIREYRRDPQNRERQRELERKRYHRRKQTQP